MAESTAMLLLGLASIALLPGTSAGCPSGYAMSSINNHCYKQLDERMSYDDAVVKCEECGGWLPIIHSEEDNSAVCEEAKSMMDNVWIGLADEVWSDGSTVTIENYEEDRISWEKQPCTFMRRKEGCKWVPKKCDRIRGVVCEADPVSSDDEILLITGGEGVNDASAEVVSLTGQSLTCDPVADLPSPENVHFGSFFKHRGDPLFCYSRAGSHCVIYSPSTNTWKDISQLSASRYSPGTMVFEDYVLVSGGHEGGDSSDSWNFMDEDFERGPDLPYPSYHHCFATINSNQALLTGGLRNTFTSTNTYMFNKDTETWTPMNSMEVDRYGHACGLVGDTQVVVAGGYASGFIQSVEIFDLVSQTWSYGTDLPLILTYPTSVQLEGTFLIVGGLVSGSGLSDRVYEYDADAQDWTLKANMQMARKWMPAAYKLAKSYLNCT